MSNIEKLNFKQLPEVEYYKACELTFQHFARPENQKMSKEEFTKLVGQIQGRLDFDITDDLINLMYQNIDQKKDGVLDIQEFYSACHHYYYQR